MPHLRPARRRASSAPEQPAVDIRPSIHTHPIVWNTHMLANGAALLVAGLAALAFIGFALNALVLAVGVVNPAWQTYKTLELTEDEDDGDTSDSDDGRDYVPTAVLRANWASYWVLAALLYLVVQLVSLPAAFVTLPQPLLPALLVPTLLYLTRADAANSRRVYDDVARPLLNAASASVDGSIDSALAHLEYLTSVALVQFYAAVHPYTASLQRAAAAAMRTIEQGDSDDTSRRVRRRRSGRNQVTSS